MKTNMPPKDERESWDEINRKEVDKVNTYPEMNNKIVDLLILHGTYPCLYAAKYIKELQAGIKKLKEIHCIDVDKTSDKIAEAFGGGE